jgi:hypothetical protein
LTYPEENFAQIAQIPSFQSGLDKPTCIKGGAFLDKQLVETEQYQ